MFRQTIAALHGLLQKKEICPTEVVASVLDCIDEKEEAINAYITVTAIAAEERAKSLHWSLALPPLWGIPMALKDNIDTLGVRTTCGSHILATRMPETSAAIARTLENAGAVLIGKANLDQFAVGSSTETSDYGPSRNPWDTKRVPGGSSGGSAAAVAAGEAIFSIGTDTGGSLRQPASYCGLVAVKPTFGTVDRSGIFPLAPSLDMPGPLCRCVGDAAIVHQVITGKRMVLEPQAVAGLKIALPRQYFNAIADPAILALLRRAVDHLAAGGAEIEEIDILDPEVTIALYQIICATEAKGVLMKAPFPREDLGEELKSRLLFGAHCLERPSFPATVQKTRDRLVETAVQLMKRYDLILGPTTTGLAFCVGEDLPPSEMHLSDLLTVLASLTGLPALSLPVGLVDSLPVGLQLMAPHLREETMFRAAAYIEKAMGFVLRPLVN